jgi:hypothetical protein
MKKTPDTRPDIEAIIASSSFMPPAMAKPMSVRSMNEKMQTRIAGGMIHYQRAYGIE